MPTDYISTGELAQRRGVTVKTVLRWVAAGKVTPAMKLPGKTGAYLFDASVADEAAA
jgi:predicted site-specific integrase-resolvase